MWNCVESVQFIVKDHLKADFSASLFSFLLPGEGISQTVEQAISGDFMGSLIKQPRGCGEQNMASMTLPVIATHYLDNTNQWETVGIGRRSEAINHIRTGQQDIK